MESKTISTCWRDSLAYFKKDNLKLYLLGSLGTWQRALNILVHRFWWLFIAWFSWLGFLVWHSGIEGLTTMFPGSLVKLTTGIIITWFLQAAIYYVIIMAIRPSLEPKDYAYFIKYAYNFWLFFISGIFASNILVLSLIALPLLFFLDSDQSAKSLYLSLIRGIKAMVYFLPFFLFVLLAPIPLIAIITLITLLPLLIAFKFMYPEWSLFAMKLSAPLLPRWFAIISTVQTAFFAELGAILALAALCVFYIKIKHEHSDLFLAEK
jgi:hypothetical protein